MKKILMNIGLWIARLGGLTDPAYDTSLMGYARAGIAAWPDLADDSDDMSRRAFKTASALSGIKSPELRFAIARELYARTKA